MKLFNYSLIQEVNRAAELAAARYTAIDLLDIWARFCRIDSEDVWDKLADQDLAWTGAVPTHEPVSLARSSNSTPLTCIGVDGSQIYPDTDLPFEWSYIQAGAVTIGMKQIAFQHDFLDISSLLKKDIKRSDLDWIFFPHLLSPKIFVDLWRTLMELAVCETALQKEPGSLLLWDHPFNLNGSRDLVVPLRTHFSDWIRRQFGSHLAGIISSPRSTLLAQTLALYEAPTTDEIGSYKVAADDSMIMRHGLAVGQRSAVFRYPQHNGMPDAQVHFFFLRASEHEVMRVEVPAWIGADTAWIDLVQASILQDVLVSGYPLTLIAAHDVIAIPLELGRELNFKGLITYVAHGGIYSQPAKVLAKLGGNS